MILKTYIKPTVLEGYGTTRHALNHLGEYVGYARAFYTYCREGSGYMNNDYVYAYNIEVYKRKKHRNSPRHKVFVYKISRDWFISSGMKINQGRRTFRIEKR